MLALLVMLAAGLGAEPQTPGRAPESPPVSLERIKKELKKPPGVDLNRPVQVPVATFKSSVERSWVPTLEEWIQKEFALTALQRQSAEWGSKCCGINLGSLWKGVKNARQERKARKIREQIARELAELEARRKKKD